MGELVIRAEGLAKRYRLGLVGATTLREDLQRAWASLRGRPDPTLSIAEANDRAHAGASDHVWALRDVSFEVRRGEVLGIIGSNGAGKSTLLKIISRVTAPSAGIVRLKGRLGSLLEVGTGFHPELTGLENVFLNGAILGMTRAEIGRKLDDIVSFSGCERYIDTPVKRYSSGMLVRLGFAVAAHLESEILIVDEVLAVGDAEFQKRCLGKMEDVARQGRTVLFVSHNLAAVRALCTRAMLIERGQVTLEGEPVVCIERYLAQYDSAEMTYELQARKRASHLSRAVELSALAMVTRTSTPRLQADEPLVVRATVRANQPAGPFSFGFAIYAHDGSPVGLCFSDPLPETPPGVSRHITLEFKDHRLAPGRYRCTVSLGSGNEFNSRTDHDLVTDVLMFEILPILGRDGVTMRWSGNWGPVRLTPPTISEAS